MRVNSLNFVFRNEVKTKSKYRILNFVFQFIKNTKWHFGYTDWGGWESENIENVKITMVFFLPVPKLLMDQKSTLHKFSF